MGLQVYYIGVSVYGWYYWMFGNKQTVGPKEVPVSRVNSKGILNYSGIFLALFITIYIILLYFTDSTIPGWDALATALSLVATWMLAKKILENWIVWIVADALCIGISLYKVLYFTSALFVVYTIMAYVGYQNWKKSMQ
jgi:nicotinamide mononucleotide transporter